MKKGEKFNKLTVQENVIKWKDRILFECECGNKKEMCAYRIKNGHIKSCGCLVKETRRQMSTTHGYRYHIAYTCWMNMLRRCSLLNKKDYQHYGKKGIKVCNEWREIPKKFCDWALNNGFKKELQIDRIDNDGDYCPENCRFVTPSENCRNRKTNHLLTIFGETKTLIEWSEDKRCIINYRCLCYRIIKCGWSAEKAIITPNIKIKD